MWGVDYDSTIFLQTVCDIYGMKQCLIYNNHIVWVVNVGMYPDFGFADPVIGCDRCAHTFRTILRKSLDVHASVESNVRKQKCCGFGTLTSTSVPSDLDVLFHILHSISHKYSKKHDNYTILLKNVKRVGGFSWQITIFLE